MSDTPLLALPILEASQAQKHVTHNEALLILDAAIQLSVITRDATTPPVSPIDGDRYLLGAAPTGIWVGQGGKLAALQASAWLFATPREGWRLWAEDEDKLLVFDGAVWLEVQGVGAATEVDLLGINTTADNNNRLAVSSPGVLFSHAGNDQRLKINKQAAADTGSLLFQTNFSGHAEMGLAGDNNFHVKVSANGSTWNDALVVDRATGAVSLPNTPDGEVFATRSSLVIAVGGGLLRPDGTMSAAGGLFYRWQSGAAELPNLPGLVPAGGRMLRHYGAIGDGIVNDMAAVLAALNSGKAVDGEGLTFGISGSCEPTPAKLALANAKLKQLSPDAFTRTLSLLNVPLWFLYNVTIDMGSFITAGNSQDANGLRINGGSGALSNVTVENGGPSSALAVLNATNVTVEDCTVKGMAWTLTGITDDILQEFWISSCTNVTVSNCRAEAVTAINNGLSTVKYSRGFAIAGCSNLEVTNCRADGVDQGFDTSGSGQNVAFVFTGNHATNCGTWGFKFANTGLCGVVANCIGRDCGAAAFVCSGGQNLTGGVLSTQRIAFTGCHAFNCGSNGIWGTPKGFQIVGVDPNTLDGDPSLSFPQFITFSNCHASDLTAVPRMAYGFYSDVTLIAGASPGNSIDALCSSTGHTVADVFGFNRPRDSYDASGNHVFSGNLRTTANLSAGGLLSLDRESLTLVNGDNNNVSGYKSYSRINGPTAAFAITGLAAPVAEGAIVILHTSVTQQLTLKHASGLSLNGNRIRTMSGADLVLPSGQRHTVWLYWDGAESIWMVTGWTSSGGAGGATSWGAITGTLSAQTDLQSALDAKEVAGTATAGMAAHLGEADPHPQYLTAAEGTAAYSASGHSHADATTGAPGFMSTSDKTKLDGAAVGPAAATDNALARFDTATGKLLQDSGAILDDTGVLTLPAAAAPAAPAASKLALFATDVAGRQMLASKGPAGVHTILQPHLGRGAFCQWSAPPNSTAITLLGAGALTLIGTATIANLAATNRHTRMKRVEALVTAASTTAIAGFRYIPPVCTVGAAAAGDGGFHMIMRWGPATGVTIATHRAFAGLALTDTPTDVEPSTKISQIGMAWDAADANIQIMHNDGAGACTKIDLGAAFPVPAVDRTSIYELALFSPPGTTQQCSYLVTDLNSGATAAGTVTTNLPATTTFLGPRCYMSVGGTSSVIGVALMGIYIESDY